jgi:predicted HAD superfamily Cof-like phosphohydrolase
MTSEAHRLVTEFHETVGAAIDVRSYGVRMLRADLVREEAAEVVQALLNGGTHQIAKELADLIVVTYGTAISLGIDLDGAVAAVHASNMTKAGTGMRVRSDGKVLKGPNYAPPDMLSFVKDVP